MRRGSNLRAAIEALPSDECVVWAGRLNLGYGSAYVPGGRLQVAHRRVYELMVGPVPQDLELDHLCRNRACVNPVHLEPVTPQENRLRALQHISGVEDIRATCVRGHDRSDANTYVDPKGGRFCRPCNRAAAQASKLRRANVA